MKHLKLFGNANELQTYVEGTEYVEPFVGTDSQGGGGVKYNRVAKNIIRLFVDGSENAMIYKNNLEEEVVSLHPGWNDLDMNGEFKEGFHGLVGPLAPLITEVDLSHYTGTNFTMYTNTDKAKKYVLPDTVNEIPENCFVSNTSLVEVILGKNTKIIGTSAFYNCQNLYKCVLPEGLTEIQDEAFVDTSIERLILPKSIEKLGKDVCSVYVRSLYEIPPTVRFQGLEPPVLTIETFRDGTRLEVPMAAVETYKNIDIPGWKEKFGDKIVGY